MNEDPEDKGGSEAFGNSHSKADYTSLPQRSPSAPKDDAIDLLDEDQAAGDRRKTSQTMWPEPKKTHLEPLLDRQENNGVELAQFGGDSRQNMPSEENSLTQSGVNVSGRNLSKNQNNSGVKINMNISWWDHFKIVMFHYIEPLLLASAMACCTQLPTLSTLVYVLVMFMGLLPLVLSSNQTNIKFKGFLCCLMLVLALPLFVFKLVMIIQYRHDPTKFDEKEDMWKFLGVFTDQPVITLLIDIFQMIVCVCLIFHLKDQKEQAFKRVTVVDRLKMQTKIKLYHPYFGQKHKAIFKITFAMFLADTFILMSALQLFVLLVLIVQMLFWRRIVCERHPAQIVLLRIIQVICIVQVLIAFFLQLPIVADDWQINHQRLVQIIGIEGIQATHPYNTYARFHFLALSLAIVSAEVFFVSNRISVFYLKRSQQALEALGQVQAEVKSQSRMSSLPPVYQRQTTSMVLPRSGMSRPVSPTLSRRINRSQLLTKGTSQVMAKEETFFQSLKIWWKTSKASMIIWLCRMITFIWVYCYHDWQSVILLIWILHSTIYQDSATFKKFMTFLYMPLVTLIFLWYYCINIFGLIEWTSNLTKRADQYTWGLYQFQIPPLEILFMFCGLWSFCQLTTHLDSKNEAEQRMDTQLVTKIGNRKSSIFYQFLFLFLIYIEYPMMLFLVIAGLDKMDIYHVTMLLFFVWYTLQPSIIKNNSIWMLVYANLFVLEKYVYTLFHVQTDPPNWVEIFGFSTTYDPHSTKQYFRYEPKFDQWILVLLTFCLYRRQNILGTGDEKQFAEYTRLAENQIKLRMPRFYSFYVMLHMLYVNTIVITAFTIYLVLIVCIDSSLVNGITQTLVLILLCVYLAKGIKELLNYWNLLIFYQAIILVLMVVFQFMVQSPGFETSQIKKFFDGWPSWTMTIVKWCGFVKFDNPINLKLLPYVIFFSLAMILSKNFKTKQQIERRQLITEDDLDLGHTDLTSTPDKGRSKPDGQKDKFKNELLEEASKLAREKQMESLMMMDPTNDYRNLESEYVYNYGKISGLTTDKMEILHHKQTRHMKYKTSYTTYKLKKIWSLLDVMAAYFYIVLNVSILSFALYYQLAVFWAVALTIYMISQFINSNANYNYRQEGRHVFYAFVEQQDHKTAADRLLQTEQEILKNRQTVFLEKQNMRLMRDKRYSTRQGINNSHSSIPSSDRNTSRFGNNLRITSSIEGRDSNRDLERQRTSGAGSITSKTLDLQMEMSSSRRLNVMDTEVIKEIENFHKEIHQVSVRSRYFAWTSLMILLIVGLGLTYMSSFAHLYEDTTESPFEEATRQKLLFFFFWGGVYSDFDYGTYTSSTYPFYILLFLLIIERLSQIWIEDRFGCDEKVLRQFQSVEKKDIEYKNQAKERKRTFDRKSIRRHRTGRASRMSMVSEATSEASRDSFATDPDMKAGSLLTIEEEKKGHDESSRSLLEANSASIIQEEGHTQLALSQPRPSKVRSAKITSINDSYKSQAPIEESDVDRLIVQQRPTSLLIQDIRDMGEHDLTPEPALSDTEYQNWEQRDEDKKKLIEELRPLLNINSRLRLYRLVKLLMENLCILLVWFSCIYKQNILSMVLFFFLVIYTYRRTGSALLLVRSTVVVIFVLQYWIEVLNLSYYNSPKPFPVHVTGNSTLVYPNADHYYYDIPLIMSYNTTLNSTGQITNSTADLQFVSYFAMDAAGRKNNGIWIDFVMTVIVAIYFSICNFWMLFRPIKVAQSDETKEKLEQYRRIMIKETGNKKYKRKTQKQLTKELKMQFGMSKLIKAWSETIYTTFPILLIAFTLAISIFNTSILSFGYIIFVTILVFDNLGFLQREEHMEESAPSEQVPSGSNGAQPEVETVITRKQEPKVTLYWILKYFMLPYLLIDILLQLIYQIPIQAFEDASDWSKAIGFERVWLINPAQIWLGEDIQVDYQVGSSLATMMLKGVTFFLITIQLHILASFRYQKYKLTLKEKAEETQELVGRGITYRFNNFKSKQVLKQAKETHKVEVMLRSVKRLIRQRESIFKRAHQRKDTIVSKNRNSLRHSTDLKEILEEQEFEKGRGQTYEEKLADLVKLEREKIKVEYEKRMSKLSCCNKVYLWMRRNWVVDILFKNSDEQLDDIVTQMKKGRTNIKTTVEIGLQNQAKKERSQVVDTELNALVAEQPAQAFASKEPTKRKDEKAPRSPKREEAGDKEIIEEGMPVSGLTQILDSDDDADSHNFDRNLNNLMSSIPDEEAEMEQEKRLRKRLLGDLLKSEIFHFSTKPWEIVNMDNFLTWHRTLSRYIVVIYKALVSYSELFCYIMMLLATLMKAGWLYMVYPVTIFGYCMLEEKRPGRTYWFFILFYTQFLLIVNFMVQLELWNTILPEPQKTNYLDFFERNKLGIHKLDAQNFGDTFVFYFPEIFILFATLVHIQKEVLAGVFDVPFDRYETFEEGLLRYRLEVLCQTEEERQSVIGQFSHEQALHIKFDHRDIDLYRETVYLSEDDKKMFRPDITPRPSSLEYRPDVAMENMLAMPGNEFIEEVEVPQNLNTLVWKHEQENRLDSESSQSEASSHHSVKTEDNINYRNTKETKGKFNLLKLIKWMIYENPFMTRLFPLIKQQKPGTDLYVYIATIQIILVIYVFLFYANMQGNESDIATQFASNSYSSNMVILLIIMICIMIVDRVLYSTHAFLSGSKLTYDQSPHEDLNSSPETKVEKDKQNHNESALMDESMLHRESGQALGRRHTLLQHDSSTKNVEANNWIEEQLALSDDEFEDEGDRFVLNKHLIPQHQKANWTRVSKFYWFWFILLISHYFVFFGLPSTVAYCQSQDQIDQATGATVSYGEPGYYCNTFTNNGWIITFYILLSIYFTLQAYQMRIGLPEIRKGSFLMDSFNPVSGIIYRGYLAIPFIFELRTLIDWTFTNTSLDAFQWIKLAQIQANMYVAKCVNKDYIERPLGKRIQKWEKIVVGFGLMIFIILMIVGPIILFSSLNPIAQIDNPTGGQLKAYISFANATSSTNQTLPLFLTSQVTQVKPISQSQYTALDFGSDSANTGQFDRNQIAVMQFSQTSDVSWIVSQPAKTQFNTYLNQFVNGTLESDISLYYSFQYTIDREEPQYGSTTGGIKPIQLKNNTQDIEIARNLSNQINCTATDIETIFPANVTITVKTNQEQSTADILTGNPAFTTNYALKYSCDPIAKSLTTSYWDMRQVFSDSTDPTVVSAVNVTQSSVFYGQGFGFYLFQQKVLPSFFASYSTNLVVFYVGIVLVVATIFRSALVPRTWEIFIIDAPKTENILKICQSIHVYRVQRELEKEEELYMILIDIMRSPEMIKALCDTSMKKKLP